jgi:hypothetical protein
MSPGAKGRGGRFDGSKIISGHVRILEVVGDMNRRMLTESW